jgi:predicted dehydrogenase
MALQLASGPLVTLSMSCASHLGIGHRIEFFGEDGTLMLHNPGADYMRGFELWHARRDAPLVRVATDDPVDAKYPDGRIAPVSRLAKIFFDAIESGGTATPGFAEGCRVQQFIDAARRSHQHGTWIDVGREAAKEEMRA